MEISLLTAANPSETALNSVINVIVGLSLLGILKWVIDSIQQIMT